MEKVFIVEDDDNIRDLVLYALNSSGFNPHGFSTGEDFFNEININLPDFIILDIMLPVEDGLSILKRLKLNPLTKNIPVIMLTARSSEVDKITGLDFGADDYITKPFSVLELISRIKAVLRRCNKNPIENKILNYKEITMDLEKRIVLYNEENIILTYKEFELLKTLLEKPQYVFTRNILLENIWGYDFEGESRTLDMHIKTLRQKLKDGGKYIVTVRNVGYKIGD